MTEPSTPDTAPHTGGRIIRLVAENYKRLKAIEIVPDGNVVEIRGRNAQGKTSVMDAIWHTLENTTARRSNPKPVRDGEQSAEVTIEIEGLGTVTRHWTPDGKTTLRITAPDGTKVTSPQQVLDRMNGALSFEPTKFSDGTAREQAQMLATAVDLGFDLNEFAVERKRYYDERAAANRTVRDVEAQVNAMPEAPADTPDTESSPAELMTAWTDAQKLQQRHTQAAHEVRNARTRIDDLNRQREQAEKDLALWEDRAAGLDPVPDLTSFADRIAAIDDTNRDVRTKIARDAKRTQLADAKAAADSLDRSIAELDKAKDDALAAADLPVDGLGLTEDGVTLHGIPLEQVSASERLKVAVAIGMTLNPDLRIMRITDASLLDAESMAMIAQLAVKHDFQAWVEVVSDDGSVGILIEDGEVA